MGGISFKTLKNYTVDSDYGIGELKLSTKGKLERINNHASECFSGKNKVCTTDEQNRQVREAVFRCLDKNFNGDGEKLIYAKTLASDFLMGENEILSRDEAGYIVSMLEKAEKGQFNYKECRDDILRIRDIKKNGVNENNLEDAKRLIRGLQVSGMFSDSKAILEVSENYQQRKDDAASSMSTGGSQKVVDSSETGVKAGSETTVKTGPANTVKTGPENTVKTGPENTIEADIKARHEKVFSGVKLSENLENEPKGSVWQSCKMFVQSMLESKETLGLTDSELSYMKLYLNKNSQGIFDSLVTRNKTGSTLDKLAEADNTAPLTSLIRGVLEDIVRPYRSFMADGWKIPSAEGYKATSACGPESKRDVELNRFWSQSNTTTESGEIISNGTCFMMSVVNGLAQTERGVSLLKDCLQDDSGNIKACIAGKETVINCDRNKSFEERLHLAYENELAAHNKIIEEFGTSGNVETFAPVLGLRVDEALFIANAQPTDKLQAFEFAAKVSAALKEGKVCTMFCGGHYRAISAAYIDSNGIPKFQFLESNGKPPRVVDEPVSKSMEGDYRTSINIFKLPPIKVPKFHDVDAQLGKKGLNDNISGHYSTSVAFAKYFAYFRPGLINNVRRQDIGSFLDRIGDRLNLSSRISDWSGGKKIDGTNDIKQCIIDCFAHNPKSPLFTNPEYDKLFSPDRSVNLDDLEEKFLSDLKQLNPIPKKEAPKPVEPKQGNQQQGTNSVSKSKNDNDAQREANLDTAERVKRQSENASINGGGGIGDIQYVDVSKQHIFASEHTTRNVNAVKDNEQKKSVSGWEKVCGNQKQFFNNMLVNKIGEHDALWRDTSKDLPKDGFKALVLCWLDRNSPGQEENAESSQEKVANPFHAKVAKSFNPSTFRLLATAFADVFNKVEFSKTLNNAKPVGGSILERYGKIPADGTINKCLQMLADKANVDEGMINSFKEELMKGLLNVEKLKG